MLSRELASPVDDQTGLAGRYDFQLEFAPSGSCQQAADTSDKTAATASLDRPSVFAALQEQIGLKLETGKGLVETIVVDRIERPTGN
jgi:uncharacterized protein (TIGR03435 family)